LDDPSLGVESWKMFRTSCRSGTRRTISIVKLPVRGGKAVAVLKAKSRVPERKWTPPFEGFSNCPKLTNE